MKLTVKDFKRVPDEDLPGEYEVAENVLVYDVNFTCQGDSRSARVPISRSLVEDEDVALEQIFQWHIEATEIEKLVYNGKITTDWYDEGFGDLGIGGGSLASEWENSIPYDKKIHLRYIISDKPITQDPDELMMAYYYGALEAEYTPIFGSEWTGQYGVDEFLTIGGHNLYDELLGFEGKYCYLELWWQN